MHARLFMRTSGKGWHAWLSILRSLQVTGLLNGSDLRKTAVWESIDVPFCLIFARNIVPEPGYRFQYSTPHYEPDLNGRGRLRIDYEAAHQVDVERATALPWLLKTLSVGTRLDVELMESLNALHSTTLGDFWQSWAKAKNKTGQGYNRSPKLRQKPADFLGGLHDFEPTDDDGFAINYEEMITYCDKYGVATAHGPRKEELYQPPLVIIPQSPGDDPATPRAYLSDRPLAFSQSYYGYSCSGHPQKGLLAAFLYLLPHSTLFSYFCLMTSRRSGFDRQTFNKEEFDALPFPNLSELSAEMKRRIIDVASELQHGRSKPWKKLNELIFGIYGLDNNAIQIAADTLFASVSYRKAGRLAIEYTDKATRARFIAALSGDLEPFFEVCGEQVNVREIPIQADVWNEPWCFLSISRKRVKDHVNPNVLREAVALGNRHGVSRIIVGIPGNHGLLLGLLNRRRWWTVTRAQLCAQHIIRNHLSACGLPEGP